MCTRGDNVTCVVAFVRPYYYYVKLFFPLVLVIVGYMDAFSTGRVAKGEVVKLREP